MKLPHPNALDLLAGYVSPAWANRRLFARARLELARAYYDGATTGRRTASLRRRRGDANAVAQQSLYNLREHCRDLDRNNVHARRAREAITSNLVGGTGIRPHFIRDKKVVPELETLAARSLDSTELDPNRKQTYAGIQSIATDACVRDGEVLVRRRWRRPSDGLAVPVQFQVLEADYLDLQKNISLLPDGGAIIQGIEYSPIGMPRAYWLFPVHPGSMLFNPAPSKRIPAEDIAHYYRVDRPGQVRGIPWGAATILALADFGDYEDAQRMRQKIAACYAVFITEAFDTAIPTTARTEDDGSIVDSVEPGMIERLKPGQEVKFATPPGVEGYGEFAQLSLHAIAAGWGISYEALTGDMSGVNFASGKMGRLEFDRNLEKWTNLIAVPSLCDPMVRWWLEAAELTGANVAGVEVRHTPPARAMIDPTREANAEREELLSGQTTFSEMARRRGKEPREHFQEYADDLQMLDDLKIKLASDPRQQAAVDPFAGGGGGGSKALAGQMRELSEKLDERGRTPSRNGHGRA